MMLEFLCGKVILYSLPDRPIETFGSSGRTNRMIVRHYIPFGATHWRQVPSEVWLPLNEMPLEILAKLNDRVGMQKDSVYDAGRINKRRVQRDGKTGDSSSDARG